MKLKFLLTSLILILNFSCSSGPKEPSQKEKRAMLHYSHGTEALLSKDYTTALDHLLKSDKLVPNQPKTLNNLGMAYFFKKETQRALKAFLLALKLDSKNSDARNNLASVYLELGKLNTAQEHYKLVLKDLVYRHQYRVWHNLAIISLKKGNKAQAVERLKKSVAEKEDYCPANYKLGNIAYDNYDYYKALKYYKDSIKGSCYNLAQPHMRQAETYIHLKMYKEAKDKLGDITQQFKGTRFDTLARIRINDLESLEKNGSEITNKRNYKSY